MFPPSLRRRAEAFAERPYARLARHFLIRLVRAGEDAPSTEFELGVGGLLAVLAIPGAFAAFLMIDNYSTFLNWVRGRLHQDVFQVSLSDKYVFICLAMAVTGIVTVLKWDRILPDSQDYLNLAPLPVRPWTVLFANASAIAIAVMVFVVDVNAIQSVLFPLFVSASVESTFPEFLRFVGVHAAVTLLASFFTFCAVFAFFGMLSAALPRKVFQTCSAWLRGAALVAFTVLLLTSYTGPALVQQLRAQPDSPLRLLPSLWYIGLYQNLQHRGGALLEGLGRTGLRAAALAFAFMLIAYGFGYRKRYAGVLESGGRPSDQRLLAPFLWIMDWFAPRSATFQRACHRFVVRALLRNESHRMCIAVAVGLGWLVASRQPAGAPLIVAYLTIVGVRLSFELPAGVGSGWVFRATLDPRANETLPVARRVILAFLAILALAPTLALGWHRAGFPAAALETAYVLALSVGLMEILLRGYRKIPVTCPTPGMRDRFPMLCLEYLLGFAFFTQWGAVLEAWMFRAPLRFLLLPLALLAYRLWDLRRRREAEEAGELEHGLSFENIQRPAVERLNLS